jgi:hypothetical protein
LRRQYKGKKGYSVLHWKARSKLMYQRSLARLTGRLPQGILASLECLRNRTRAKKGTKMGTRGKPGMVLKVKGDNPAKEFRFELAYLRSLTTQERFALMLRRSREMAEVLSRHGHRKTAGIIKRP